MGNVTQLFWEGLMDENYYILKTTEMMQQGLLEPAQSVLGSALLEYPRAGQLHFLMAAILAQLESYEDALESYQMALNNQPDLHIARFQKGLLLATLEQNSQAYEVLVPLTKSDHAYLQYFSLGIISVLDNRIPEAIAYLNNGISENLENITLNQDMKNLIQRLENHNAEKADTTNQINSPDDSEIVDRDIEQDKTHLLDIYQSH
jgi:tetratricopeptide (TPR) repeat protein